MTDDYTSEALAAKYDDMTAERLNAMTTEERGEYYHAMYQYFGRMLFIVHETKPAILDDNETWAYPNIPQAEYWALSTLHRSFMAVVDGLAGLTSMADQD